jgi:hypothetical protein
MKADEEAPGRLRQPWRKSRPFGDQEKTSLSAPLPPAISADFALILVNTGLCHRAR